MFRLFMLGGLALERDATPLGHLPRPRALAVLVVVAASDRHGISRDRVTSLLWPEASAEHAHHSLNQWLHVIRADLGNDVLLQRGPMLRPNGSVLWTDVTAFEDALARHDTVEATALYVGPFLDGVHPGGGSELDSWIDRQRARLAGAFARMLEEEAARALGCGDARASAEWYQRLVDVEPLAAEAVVGLVAAHRAAGNDCAAARAAREYVARAYAEGLVPDPRVAR